MDKPVILVTEPEFAKARDVFQQADDFDIRSAPTEEIPLGGKITQHNCRAVILGVHKYTGKLYEALSQVSSAEPALIARFGVGHDGIDKKLIKQYNIFLTNTPGVLEQSVAEHALWLMGALARKVCASHANMIQGKFAPTIGGELCGKILGIIGFGPIGRRVGQIASFGFDMNVLAVDIIPADNLESYFGLDLNGLKQKYGIATYTTDVHSVFQTADIISIHLPANKHTHHFVNADRLSLMKTNALLVNTSRGVIVDENALYDALKRNNISGAGLDVFEKEPYQPVTPVKDLRTLDSVALTPHIGSSTFESCQRMAQKCMQNIRDFLNGAYDKLNRVDNA